MEGVERAATGAEAERAGWKAVAEPLQPRVRAEDLARSRCGEDPARPVDAGRQPASVVWSEAIGRDRLAVTTDADAPRAAVARDHGDP